jgi:NTP pyrophosphatase (non-canonical NTP hydrolase)
MPNQNIAELSAMIASFRDERDWRQFHTFKDLALALAIETGELQELFLWQQEHDLELKLTDPDFKERLADELADVLGYLLLLADKASIDAGDALVSKISKNALKYPVNKVKGDSRKYNEY